VPIFRSVAFGLRHEAQSHLRGAGRLSPRAGLAWSPRSNLGLQAGAGVFNDWYAADVYERTLQLDGLRQRESLIAGPGFPDPSAGGIGQATTAEPGRRIELGASLSF
jgi:hypothetical protein